MTPNKNHPGNDPNSTMSDETVSLSFLVKHFKIMEKKMKMSKMMDEKKTSFNGESIRQMVKVLQSRID